jgi:DNA modification methylase
MDITDDHLDKDLFSSMKSGGESKVILGDCLTSLENIESKTYQTCITSPPYYDQRDYDDPNQIGLEKSPDAFVAKLVSVFTEVHRVLKDDGTLWINIADTYSKNKNLLGIPWRLAFALQDSGWNLRQDIIWSKPNPMPEPVRDRCARSHEYVFLFTKQKKYLFDASAIREQGKVFNPGSPTTKNTKTTHGVGGGNTGLNAYKAKMAAEIAENGFVMRNKRSVWEVQIRPSREGHFATYPEELIEPMVKACSREGDTILDPFGGSGTTAIVANRMGRHCDLLELNPEYAALAARRTGGTVIQC